MQKRFNRKPKDTALERAVRLLARREHSYHELVQKLTAKGFYATDITSALDSLVEKGWQCDLRFTESWIRHRIESGFGPRKIRQELSQKGVNHSTIELGFENIAPKWQKLAQQVWQKKYNCLPLDWNEKAKQIRFLMYRGFSNEQIEAMYQLEQQKQDDL